jgi:drug/metabolite transporter (DMT)-like permease
MTAGGGSATAKRCGLTEMLIFVAAIVTGTACSICSKTMMDLKGTGMTGETEAFSKPIFQTFGMFVGMTFGLVMHGVVLAFRIPFPGYTHDTAPATTATKAPLGYPTEKDALVRMAPPNPATTPAPTPLPLWMYFFLAIPSIFDLGATVLCMLGLRFLDVSIYQLLRGSGIIFVALMKQYALKDRLYTYQWLGVVWNVVSVIMVGMTAVLASQGSNSHGNNTDGSLALVGIILVLCGALVQALQFVFEEKVMTMDIPAPPLLLIGMEGLWGTVLCLLVVYPIAYMIPGADHGSFEHFGNTWYMIMHTPTIQYMFLVYFFAIFGYNIFAVLVTFLLNSIWHAILDNFRPITVWLTDMVIFYLVDQSFGEPWTTWSFLQLAGMVVLLYGTAIYNAPHAGSVLLKGEWFSWGLNFSKEYDEVADALKDAELDALWEDRKIANKRTNSSFIGGRSPFLAPAQKF